MFLNRNSKLTLNSTIYIFVLDINTMKIVIPNMLIMQYHKTNDTDIKVIFPQLKKSQINKRLSKFDFNSPRKKHRKQKQLAKNKYNFRQKVITP